MRMGDRDEPDSWVGCRRAYRADCMRQREAPKGGTWSAALSGSSVEGPRLRRGMVTGGFPWRANGRRGSERHRRTESDRSVGRFLRTLLADLDRPPASVRRSQVPFKLAVAHPLPTFRHPSSAAADTASARLCGRWRLSTRRGGADALTTHGRSHRLERPLSDRD